MSDLFPGTVEDWQRHAAQLSDDLKAQRAEAEELLVERDAMGHRMAAAEGRARALTELLKTLVYWHDQDNGHIDESWWDAARGVLKEHGQSARCWGCECDVPVRDGRHIEETDVPGCEYTYPCAASGTSASRVTNMYDLLPCPKCGSRFRAPFRRANGAVAECDDCGLVEPLPAGHYAREESTARTVDHRDTEPREPGST